jgi:phospholipid N-methyltransferase
MEHERNRFEELAGRASIVVAAHQLFPTPPARVAKLAEIDRNCSLLEPSAGTGRLLESCRAAYSICAVEINRELSDSLQRRYPFVRVHCRDFLECNDLGTFDRIVMNPPFTRGSDIKHIEHARKFLSPGGRLVSLCAAGPRQREKLQRGGYQWIDLPAGSFKSEGTDVASAIVIFEGRG